MTDGDPVEVNRLRWEEMATLHITKYFEPDAAVTDVALKPFEVDELGDLTGRRVCHLQCHLGGDSLSLARLGAEVVGVDFSATAVEAASRRAVTEGLDDRVSFVCARVEEAPALLGEGRFDVVYTSWGVLCWLPDLDVWARTVAALLASGGWLYLAETHPYASALRWPEYPYGAGAATFDEGQGDYTDRDAQFDHPQSWEWSHGLGDVVSALAGAGMTVEWLHEWPVVPWDLNDGEHMVRRADRLWEVPGSTLPLSYSLRAAKLPATVNPARTR